MGAQLISQGLEVSANSVFQDTHVFWIPMADRACKMFHCLFLNTILLSRIVNHQCSNKIKLDLILCFKNKQIFQSPFYNFCHSLQHQLTCASQVQQLSCPVSQCCNQASKCTQLHHFPLDESSHQLLLCGAKSPNSPAGTSKESVVCHESVEASIQQNAVCHIQCKIQKPHSAPIGGNNFGFREKDEQGHKVWQLSKFT